jgi:transposase
MKDHPERSARLHLIEHMLAGHSWQMAVAESKLNVSRATAYRLVQLARDEDKAELALLDRRHGHSSKLTQAVQVWMSDLCTQHPHLASSRVQAELKTTFGVVVSVSQINRVRAKLRVTKQGRGKPSVQRKKN